MNMNWTETAKQLPDDELTVLVATSDGEVWTGYHSEGCWWYVSADKIGIDVTHWMSFPEPPGAN